MDLSKLKVGTRLGIGFGAVCILLLVIATLGIAKLSQLNAATALVVDDKLPKVQHAYHMMNQVDTITIALRDMLLAPAEAQRQRDTILGARQAVKESLDELQRTVASPEGVALLKDVAENRARFVGGQNTIIEHVRAGRAQEAQDFLTGELRQVQQAYKDTLARLIQHETDEAAMAGLHAATTYSSSRTWLVGLGLAAVAIAAVTGLAITRSLLRQLGGEPAYASAIAREIAAGNLGVDVRVADGDNSSLLYAMRSMREQLAAVVREVRSGTDLINTAASEIAAGNEELAARTEQEASSLEQTASSLEELTQTVRENAANARQANELAASAAGVARDGGAVVAQVVERMDAINTSSRSIVEIISVIDGIAFQTNILALNAAVEAARAGEQGRGFAVVATEVRTLAQRSAAAAKQIKQLIDSSVEQVDAGAKLVDEAGMTMSSIIDSVRRVAAIMAEITTASAEQSDGLDQINKAVAQMDEVTQQNAALVEEAAATSASMREKAETLAHTVRVFKLDGATEYRDAPAVAPRVAAGVPQLQAY